MMRFMNISVMICAACLQFYITTVWGNSVLPVEEAVNAAPPECSFINKTGQSDWSVFVCMFPQSHCGNASMLADFINRVPERSRENEYNVEVRFDHCTEINEVVFQLDTEIQLNKSLTLKSHAIKIVFNGSDNVRLFRVGNKNKLLNVNFKNIQFESGIASPPVFLLPNKCLLMDGMSECTGPVDPSVALVPKYIGGCLLVEHSAYVKVSGSTFLNCSTSAGGLSFNAVGTRRPNDIEYNGGAIAATEGTQVDVRQSTFTGNFASGSGAAIHARSATLRVFNSEFTTNKALGIHLGMQWGEDHRGGGAIAADGASQVGVLDSWFHENEAPAGGAVHVHQSDVLMRRSLFIRNRALMEGGAAIRVNSSGCGNGYGMAEFEHVTFLSNEAKEDKSKGGAVHFILTGETFDVLLTNCSFDGNAAEFGLHVYVDATINTAALNITSGTYAGQNQNDLVHLESKSICIAYRDVIIPDLTCSNCSVSYSGPSGIAEWQISGQMAHTTNEIASDWFGNGARNCSNPVPPRINDCTSEYTTTESSSVTAETCSSTGTPHVWLQQPDVTVSSQFTGVTSSSSMWNDAYPDYALDTDGETCFVSGHEPEPWWKAITSKTEILENVVISGTFVGKFRIRIGYDTSDTGAAAGHEKNPTCAAFDLSGTVTDRLVECVRPLSGNVLSVEVTSSTSKQMKICNMAINE